MAKIALIILAGGNSKRMHFPKPWLLYDKDTTFLERILSCYSSVELSDRIIVLNKKCIESTWQNILNKIKQNCHICENNHPENGRLYSLNLGLKMAVNIDFAIVHSVDQPFVEIDVIHQIMRYKNSDGATIPSFNNKGGHPIIIGNKVINEILHNYSNYSTLKDVLEKFSKTYANVSSPLTLTNINTPQDYQQQFYLGKQ